MKNTCILLVDYDDVLNNLNEQWVTTLNEMYNLSIKPEDVQDFDMSKTFTTLTKEQIESPLYFESFWDKVTIRDDAKIYLKKLYDKGFKIYVCTTTNIKTLYQKGLILEKNFPFLTRNDIIRTSNKRIIHGNYIIDDNIENIAGCYADGILFDKPYNRKFKEKDFDIKRVYNWEELYDYIITDWDK